MIIKQTGVEYGDLLNYTLAINENKIGVIPKKYSSSDATEGDGRRTINSIVSLLEFSFFAYSASPKVNHTIRICRMVSTAVDVLNTKTFSYEHKHLVFKFIHDNVLQMLEKNKMSALREVESLYLLSSLSQIGKEYWLPEPTIAKHFLIEIDKDTWEYYRHDFLSHFAITVLLSYIKAKVRYDRLRAFIQSQALEKFKYARAHGANDAEILMLFLDLIVCPYIDLATKSAAAKMFGIDAAQLADIQSVNDYWFTAWGEEFRLSKELDAKRSREVY